MANIAYGKSIFKNNLLYLMNWTNICEKKFFHFKTKEEQNHDYLLFIPFFSLNFFILERWY